MPAPCGPFAPPPPAPPPPCPSPSLEALFHPKLSAISTSQALLFCRVHAITPACSRWCTISHQDQQFSDIRRPTRAHPLHIRSTLLHFTCARDKTILPRHVPGRAADGHVLADRAQNSSAGTAGRLPVQWHVHNRPVCEAAASPVSRRCTAVPIGAEGAARSALKAASEVGTGGPATSGHRGRCHTDQSRPWGRMRGARGAID